MSDSKPTFSTPTASIPVAIYTRVSTQHQVGGRFDSCESQASICREYLRRHADQGWYETALYSDPAYSGGTLKRPGMEQLMRHIATGGVKILLIFKFERVLRSTDEWGPFRNFLKKHGCRLQSPMEDLTEETAMDRFQNNLRANLAEFDRFNTAEKVRAKMLEQAKRGFWNCGPVPFGYDYNSEKQWLSPNPAEAPIVARVFRETAALVSLTDIANALGNEGIRTRVRHNRRRDGGEQIVGGKRFRSDGLRMMIKNPIYSGRVRFLGHDYAAQHEAIVPNELWERANAAIGQSRPQERQVRPNQDTHFHLLKGVLRCEHCGRTMFPKPTGKRDRNGRPYRYYTCGNAEKERDTANCPVRHVSAACIEAAVVGFMGRLASHPSIVEATTQSARVVAQEERAPLQQELTAISDQAEQTAAQIRNCVEAVALGGAELLGDELKIRIQTLKTEKQQLLVRQEQLRQLLRAYDEKSIEPSRIRRAMGNLERLLPQLPKEEQKPLVALCFERIGIKFARGTGLPRGRRRIDLICKVRLARLVECMEEKVTMHRTGSDGLPLAERKLAVTMELELNSNGTVAVLSPFQAMYGERSARRRTVRTIKRARHPIHRALAWKQALDLERRLTQVELAKREGLKAATITYHMNLLRLAPEIQKFLFALSSAPAIRPFGLVRMRDLSKLDLAAQRQQFALLRRKIEKGRRT